MPSFSTKARNKPGGRRLDNSTDTNTEAQWMSGIWRSVVNGLPRMAIRATSDCLCLSSRCPTSSDGSASDRISGLGVRVVSPSTSSTACESTSVFSADFVLGRLLWRAYQVVQTPNEILVHKLGLDIPPAPETILEEILSREIHITWKQPELPNSIHKHILHINGKKGLLTQPFF